MRQIEKHAKKYPVDDVTGQPVASRGSSSKKVRQALANQEKQKAAAEKETAKAQQEAITRHRSLQSQETRDRMDQHLKEANKRHSKQKEFFLVRWFKPKDDIEKMEKRQAKDVQKRMAATRKQADKNNKDMGMSRTVKTKEVKRPLPSPNDMPQGGGGVYKAGSSKKYTSPNNVQHGGGGVYKAGSSRNNVSPNNVQQGGGGSYAESSSRNRLSSSDFQQGGGGTYQTGKSNKGVKASDIQQGGGGKMPKESRRNRKKKK